jgi:hypothetical protein
MIFQFKYTGEEITIGDKENQKVILEILNENFLGWIYLYNNGKNKMKRIFHVEKYVHEGDLHFKADHRGPKDVELLDLENIEIGIDNYKDDMGLYPDDVIYKLVELDESKEAKIRWWKDGKLESKIITNFELYEKIEYDDDLDFEDEEDEDAFITNQDFKKFLIDNGVYNKYVKYCNDNKYDVAAGRNMSQDFQKYKPEDYLFWAFTWEYTDEGHGYWQNLNNKWQVELLNLKEGVRWYKDGKLEAEEIEEDNFDFDDSSLIKEADRCIRRHDGFNIKVAKKEWGNFHRFLMKHNMTWGDIRREPEIEDKNLSISKKDCITVCIKKRRDDTYRLGHYGKSCDVDEEQCGGILYKFVIKDNTFTCKFLYQP